MVDIENGIYDRIGKAIKKSIKYANIRQFVNLAVKEKLDEVEKKK